MKVKIELTIDVAGKASTSDIVSEIESLTGGSCNKVVDLHEIPPQALSRKK